MSKINQIQNALKELDGGAFQKLADAYLIEKGYQNINPIGSVIGADKVQAGTPDSFSRLENGKLIFFEHTTDKKLPSKLRQDLEKCLDSSKTGIELSEIEEIVFCHNSPDLSLEDTKSLIQICREKEVKIQIFGLGNISFDLYQKYPAIASDFLGVNIDTGQITSPSIFVQNIKKNKSSTPLDTTFYGRQSELENLVKNIESDSLVILTGSAGVGKSRLALQALEHFENQNSDFELYVIQNKGPNLFEDIRSYFSKDGKFLILVDDANRITQFDYIVELLLNQRDDQTIKVIATVRDYARDAINYKAKSLEKVSEIKISPFESKEIKELVKNQYKIRNSDYLERISDIAAGNPRLAIMAATLAVKENSLQSISDVSALYDEYFSSITNDLKNFQEPNILKVAGILSFFRSIDRSNTELAVLIDDVFQMAQSDFWEAINFLHHSEIVDVYEKEVVKINDQVFSTYLFYLCFFKEKEFSFSLLLDNFFPSQVGKLRDALYPCFNAFDYEEIYAQIKKDVIAKWQHLIDQDNEKNINDFIKTFWFMIPSEVLVYCRNKIDNLEKQPLDLSAISFEDKNVSLHGYPLLENLALFNCENDKNIVKMTLDLLFDYTEKWPSLTPQFLKLMTEDYGFKRNSHKNGYLVQTILIDTLWSKASQSEGKLFSRCFIYLASEYLKSRFDSTESSGRSITIYKFDLLEADNIFNLRKKIFDGLFQLYKDNELKAHVSQAIKNYCGSGYYLSKREIIERDAEYILSFFEKEFDPNNFNECLLVQEYNKLLTARGIDAAEDISLRFISDTYQVYKLLSFDFLDVEQTEISDFDEIKEGRIRAYTQSFTINDFQKFIEQSAEILSHLRNDRDNYQIRNGIIQCLLCLCEGDNIECEKVIRHYLESGNVLEIGNPILLVKKLVSEYGAARSFNILNTPEYKFKNRWLFDYYTCLESDDISPDKANELISLYQTSVVWDMPRDFDYLLNYLDAEKNIINKIISIILEKSTQEATYGYIFDLLFNSLSEINKRLPDLLENDLSIIKQAYIVHSKSNRNSDYNGSTLRRILSVDPNFILEIIDDAYGENQWASSYSDNRDYSFIWTHEHCHEIINLAIADILSREEENSCVSGDYLANFFCISGDKDNSSKVSESQDEFINQFIDLNSNSANSVQLIFRVVAYFKAERRKKFIKLFLEKNQNFHDFELLSLEPYHFSSVGSLVPVYQSRVEFWESLLPLCNDIALLDHKLFIEENIKNYRGAVEHEKKSDFVQAEYYN